MAIDRTSPESLLACINALLDQAAVTDKKFELLAEKVNRAEMNAAQAKPSSPTIQVNIDATKAIEAVNNAIAALEKAIAEFGSNLLVR